MKSMNFWLNISIPWRSTYQLGEWEMASTFSERERFMLRLWTINSWLELEVDLWALESLLSHMLMLNSRKLMNCKLKVIGISNNSLLEWWQVNLQINVEAWEAEDSKALNLHKEKKAMLLAVEIVKMEWSHLWWEELLQTTVVLEQDETTKSDTLIFSTIWNRLKFKWTNILLFNC